MKVKTSITLSEDILAFVDAHSERFANRSQFIEAALRAYMEQVQRDERNARDVSIINRHADRLNREAHDVLAYQIEL